MTKYENECRCAYGAHGRKDCERYRSAHNEFTGEEVEAEVVAECAHPERCNHPQCHPTPKRIEPLTFNKDVALNEIQMFDAIKQLIEAVNRLNKV